MSAPRILVVDDDPGVRESLSALLTASGYRVEIAADGAEGARRAAATAPDLVLTDLAMPGGDGFALIEAVRRRSATPIVVLSVRGDELDKVRALDLGADDYVTKPFSVAELLARIRRRLAPAAAGGRFEFVGLSIDLERRQVLRDGVEIRLTPTELALLALFAEHAGKPVTFRQIVAKVWGGAPATSHDTVRVHVGSLRRKLEPDPSEPRFLVTEPWVGYRFIAEPA